MAPTEVLARQHARPCAAAGAARHRRRAADRQGPGRAAARARCERLAGGASAARGRHPRAVPGRRRVPRSRPGGDRRAAPLRRRPAAGARRQGRGRRRPGDDRDADPAHAWCWPPTATSTSRSSTEKPPGRQPIVTRAVPIERLDEVVDGLGAGARPAASRSTGSARWSRSRESERPGGRRERHRLLGRALRRRGRPGPRPARRPRARRRRWRAFAAGGTPLLVATTVIEVGVDVPEATHHRDRARRALRPRPAPPAARPGRPRRAAVGLPAALRAAARRGRARPARDPARDRGRFAIAEEDLRLRGPGEVLGLRQSGVPGFRFADLGAIRRPARDAPRPGRAAAPSGPEPGRRARRALRVLLHLFERHDAVRLLAAG